LRRSARLPGSRAYRRTGAAVSQHGFDLLAQAAQGALELRSRRTPDPFGESRELPAKPPGGTDRLADLRLDRRPWGQLLAEALHGQPLELCPPPQLEHRLLILLPGHADEDVAGDGRVRAVIVLDRLRQARERQRIAHMRPALVNEIGHLGMRVALR